MESEASGVGYPPLDERAAKDLEEMAEFVEAERVAGSDANYGPSF